MVKLHKLGRSITLYEPDGLTIKGEDVTVTIDLTYNADVELLKG